MAGQQATAWMGSGTIFDAAMFEDAKRRTQATDICRKQGRRQRYV